MCPIESVAKNVKRFKTSASPFRASLLIFWIATSTSFLTSPSQFAFKWIALTKSLSKQSSTHRMGFGINHVEDVFGFGCETLIPGRFQEGLGDAMNGAEGFQ